jgi:hypothetical protein
MSHLQAGYDLVAVMGGEAVEMYEKGIAALGGIKNFVKAGQTVVVKPNIGWDRAPEYGANTNPQLVGKRCRSHSDNRKQRRKLQRCNYPVCGMRQLYQSVRQERDTLLAVACPQTY